MVLLNLIFFRLKGNTGVAAYGIAANLALVALSIFSGVSQGVQPLFSSQYGAGNRAALRRTLLLYFSGFLFAGFNLVFGVLLSCIGRQPPWPYPCCGRVILIVPLLP